MKFSRKMLQNLQDPWGKSEPQKFYFNIIKVLFLKDDVHFLPNPGKRPKPGIRRPLPSDDLIKMNSFRVKYG